MEQTYEKRGYLLEDFRLFHLHEAQKTAIEAHYHEFGKIFLLLSGSGSYFVEGQRYLLRAGDVVLVGSRRVHRPEFTGPYERVILYVSPAFLQRFAAGDCHPGACFDRGPVLRLEEGQRRRIFAMAASLERELAGQAYGHMLLAGGLVLRLLVELERCCRQGEADRTEPVQPRNSRVLDVLRYIDDHLAEDLSVDDLAARFFISKYYLMHLFREETGTSIHAYLTGRRLVQARELIDGGMQATRACFQVGFRSYSSFIRSYEKTFGQTPMGRGSSSRRQAEDFE